MSTRQRGQATPAKAWKTLKQRLSAELEQDETVEAEQQLIHTRVHDMLR